MLWLLLHGSWEVCRRTGSSGDSFAPAGTDAEESDEADYQNADDGGTSCDAVDCALGKPGVSRAVGCTRIARA